MHVSFARAMNGNPGCESLATISESHSGHNGSEKLRVVFFTASYFVLDGVTLTIRKLLAALEAAGCETMVITAAPTRDTQAELATLGGENLVLVPGMPVPLDKEHYGYALGLGLSREARKRLEAFKPHVAHLTVCDLLGMDGVKWCEANGVAMVGTWHSNYCDYVKFYAAAWWLVPVLRRYIQQFYGAIKTTYVPTEYMRIKLRGEDYENYTKLKIWGRGVDLKMFSPHSRSDLFRRKYGVDSEDTILVVWVGRLVPEKRPDIFRDTLTRLRDEGHKVKGIVVGVGPCVSYFDGLDYVECAGWLSGMPLAEAYASADILLFPSDVETFGNVTLEALASGTPAIVEHNCSQHLVDNGKNGYTVHQGIDDPDSKTEYEACLLRYVDATRKLVLDKNLRHTMACSARKKAETFSNRLVQQRMIDNYHDAIEELLMAKQTPQSFMNKFKEDATHWFFASIARIIIFLLWLLLGLPQVTETNLAQITTNMNPSTESVCV